MENYNDFNEGLKLSKLRKIIPFILFSYIPNSEVIESPNVINNSDHVIYLKCEDNSDIVELSPGEIYNGRIDGIKHPKYGVYKIVDYVDDIFGIQIYNDDIKLGKLPLSVNVKLGGGKLDSPPDEGWESIFNK